MGAAMAALGTGAMGAMPAAGAALPGLALDALKPESPEYQNPSKNKSQQQPAATAPLAAPNQNDGVLQKMLSQLLLPQGS